VYHAQVAGSSATLANVHCIHAGPSGGNNAKDAGGTYINQVCGNECEGYCNLLNYTCGDAINTCMTFCATLPPTDPTLTSKDIYMGDAAKLGNSPNVACGTSEALEALEDNSAAQCKAAREAVCVSGASLLQASWAVLAVMLLALSSNL
jgi:hypothetical protein